MTQLWRYRPADNRTPKNHPIIGGLIWDQVYDNPACADDPDFEPVEDTPPGPDKPTDIPDAQPAPATGKAGKEQ